MCEIKRELEECCKLGSCELGKNRIYVADFLWIMNGYENVIIEDPLSNIIFDEHSDKSIMEFKDFVINSVYISENRTLIIKAAETGKWYSV